MVCISSILFPFVPLNSHSVLLPDHKVVEMDERANLPVSLPRSNPTTSYWQDPPDAVIADFVSPGGLPEEADTVIIGSGITGACTAFNLLVEPANPDHGKIVMLEARQACSGATGRNGESFHNSIHGLHAEIL